MLSETYLQRYAAVLLWALQIARKGRYRKGDIVLVRYGAPAVRLAEIINAALLERGLNPILRAQPTPRMERDFFERAATGQLEFVAPGEKEMAARLNGNIFLHAPEALSHLRHIEPAKIGKPALARKFIRDILEKREARGHFGWTLCLLPTDELARQADRPPEQYARQVARACFLHRKDPVARWQEVYRRAQSLKRKLNRLPVSWLHIEGRRIDLRITPGARRRWIGVSGHNIPSFELFLSPDWRGTEGVYFADLPSFRSGNYITDVRLEFKRGAVACADARVGEDFVRQQIRLDRGANKVGEFSLTDRRFSNINTFMANTLFDENHGGRNGNCHIALGASYADSFAGDPRRLTAAMKRKLGFNQSALHWDLVNTEKKRVTAHLQSGKPRIIYENGQFTD
jgi:aminopeptidase